MVKTKKPEIIHMRTWYGLRATVAIGPGFVHRAGWGAFLIPHPPVVNWLLRQGLDEKARRTLSFSHEFVHLQSAPPALLYTVVMVCLSFAMGHTGLVETVIVFISTHAAWEIISEIFTFSGNKQLYHGSYEKITMIPRIVFWFSMSTLTIIGWWVVLS